MTFAIFDYRVTAKPLSFDMEGNKTMTLHQNSKDMKAIIYIYTFFILGILLMTSSCNKGNDMPDDNKDWNVLEWTVDGEQYKAECEGDPLFGCDPVDCQFYPSDSALSIATGNDQFGIQISSNYGVPLNIGLNEISMSNSNVLNRNSDDCKILEIDSLENNVLRIITINGQDKYIEGEFDLHFRKDTCKIHLSNGYFKLSYRP